MAKKEAVPENEKLCETTEKAAPNPAESERNNVKGKAAFSQSVSEDFRLFIDRWNLYSDNRLFRKGVISASASKGYFAYVTRDGRILLSSTPEDSNEEKNDANAVQVIAHPEKPLLWYIDTDRNIFEVTLAHHENSTPIFTCNEAKGSILCRAYTTEYDNYEYRINTYNVVEHFDEKNLSAEDCALSYLKNSGEIYNLFPDFDSYTPEMIKQIKTERIFINSFKTAVRHEEQINSSTPQSDWAKCKDFADYTVSFCVTGSKKGFGFSEIRKLRNGIPRAYSGFEDFICNEYL